MFRRFCVFLLIFVVCFACLNFNYALAKEKNYYDVVVVGAGLSGVSAAISAARLGMNVLIIEDTEVVGGQAVASAVSTMDDLQATRHGIYVEFLNRATTYYKNSQTPTNICLWDSTTFAFEPKIIDKTLRELIKKTGGITLSFNTNVLSAKLEGNRVSRI